MKNGAISDFLFFFAIYKNTESFFVDITIHIVSYPLTGTLHFTHIELTDGNSRLPGQCRNYACGLTNDILKTVSLGYSHCVMPLSGTTVTDKQFEAAVFVVYAELITKVS